MMLAIVSFLTACKQKPAIATKQGLETPKYPELEYVFEQIIDHDIFKCSDFLIENLVFKSDSIVTTYSYQDFPILRHYKGVKEIRKPQKQDEILRTLSISASFFEFQHEETLGLWINCKGAQSDSIHWTSKLEHLDSPFWFRFIRVNDKWVYKDVDYRGG